MHGLCALGAMISITRAAHSLEHVIDRSNAKLGIIATESVQLRHRESFQDLLAHNERPQTWQLGSPKTTRKC